MTKSNDNLPVPKIFLINPHPFDSESSIRFINSVSEIQAYPANMEFTGGHPDYLEQEDLKWGVQILFGRVRDEENLLYIFSKSGNQNLSSVLTAFFHYFKATQILGYIILFDCVYLEKLYELYGRTWDYINAAKSEIQTLKTFEPNAKYVIALENCTQENGEDEVRKRLELGDEIKIIRHQFDCQSVKEVFIGLLEHVKTQDNKIIDDLIQMFDEI